MGKFELAVMAAVLRLRGEAYGRRLHPELEKRLGKSVPTGQIYVALARLEEKGYVASNLAAPTPVRGGRSRRIYELTGAGEQAFQSERDSFGRLVLGVSLPQEG
jgi:PadR family transcriptional regulator PadR